MYSGIHNSTQTQFWSISISIKMHSHSKNESWQWWWSLINPIVSTELAWPYLVNICDVTKLSILCTRHPAESIGPPLPGAISKYFCIAPCLHQRSDAINSYLSARVSIFSRRSSGSLRCDDEFIKWLPGKRWPWSGAFLSVLFLWDILWYMPTSVLIERICLFVSRLFLRLLFPSLFNFIM